MNFLDCTLPTLVANLALDEALLLDAEAGGPEVLRLWEWPTPAVVLGAGGKLADDVDEAACQAEGVPIARRSSGGGTVMLGPGCLLFSLVLCFERDPALADLHASYRYILHRMRRALACDAAFSGTSDLTLSSRKFSGNAQQRKRTHLLHHGTLLYHFDFAGMNRFLKTPTRQPEYRRQRSHAEFLMNLPIAGEKLRSALRTEWEAAQVLTGWPAAIVDRLVEEKYGCAEWVLRR